MQNVQRRAAGRQKSQRRGQNVPHGAKNGHPHAKSHRRMRRNRKTCVSSRLEIIPKHHGYHRTDRPPQPVARAEEVIRDSRLAEIWRSVGAEVRQVGSLRSGLLMKHRDIDFHIYSSPLRLEESFAAMAQLAADPAVGRIECRNLLATDEACVEWHATYRDRDGDEWQLDMIHIVRGSRYDGYFEHVADRIAAALTPVTRRAILQLKYDTPDDVKIAGIEYYVAVLRDGVRTYDAFAEWRRTHPLTGIVEWMP